MTKSIHKRLTEGDIEGLRYIFLDSLDIDPTFDKYRKDYELCKSHLFEEYEELTPLSDNVSDWNEDYWIDLKLAQKDNFSQKRFEHMMRVARVVYADKIKRLEANRIVESIQPEKTVETVSIKEEKSSVNEVKAPQLELKRGSAMRRENNFSTNHSIDNTNITSNGSIKKIVVESEYYVVKDGNRVYNTYPEQSSSSSKKMVGCVAVVVLIVGILLVKMLTDYQHPHTLKEQIRQQEKID